VSGRFAGEVAGIEFSYGGFEVVDVVCEDRGDSFVGIDLDDLEVFGAKSLRMQVSAGGSGMTED
jgi:hypothetical protein